MREVTNKGLLTIVALTMVFALALPLDAYAEGTRLLKIREGLHKDYSRIVLDCQGDRPTSMKADASKRFIVQFGDLSVDPDLGAASNSLKGGVSRIENGRTAPGRISLTLNPPGARVKPFILRTGEKGAGTYRVVLDVYPPAGTTADTTPEAPLLATTTAAATTIATATPDISTSTLPAAAVASAPSNTEGDRTPAGDQQAILQSRTDDPPVEEEENGDDGERAEPSSSLEYSGEASITLRSVDGEDESSEFEAYRDISQSVSGDISIDAVWDQRYYARGRATGIGQEDQYAGFEAGDYGKFDLTFSYDQFIRRYGYGARTLYSGVGSDRMSLDDALQANVQAAATPAEQAVRLNGFFASAASGDPQVERDRAKLGANLVATDPLSIKVEVTHEKRQGTRPFAGAFNSSDMVELFEPIDHETIGMKISAEYAQAPYYLNLAYHYSQFTNNNDTLTFDNPLSNDDTLAPSAGRIDLAPDNQYHNISLTGALTKLPWNSQLTANAAWGMMVQDDDWAPFTANTALAAPALPADSTDAQVNTMLYHLRLASKPLPYMRVKGRFRYYDYSNETDQIDFSGGYVETDASVEATSITNLPTSYTKTLAGLDLDFDVLPRTTLGIGYQLERTERENREVEEQDDHIFKLSADTRAVDWLNLRVLYERTNREIGDYDFDVYTKSGDDLDQLPQLRKYDQADMTRDRIQLQATVYPADTLAIGGSLTYGQDSYDDSPFGLQEDNHIIAAVDADYAINDRASINLFYSMETYDNKQKGRQDSITAFDWTAEGEDVVTTVGGSVTAALLPQKLDFKLSYAYSEVDGNLSFSSPAGAFADFSAVDDTTLHVLDAKLTYHFNSRLSIAAGYLWESFDYEDYAAEGFRNVPTDASDNYQGALLSGILPEDYDVSIIYTQLTFRLP